MSHAYAMLQEKLNATGRTYLEGFSPQDFSGLTQTERDQVADVFRERARKGDGVALDGLRQLIPVGEFQAFVTAELRARTNLDLVTAQLAIEAFTLTASEHAFTRILDVLRMGDKTARRFTLNALSIGKIGNEQRAKLLPELTKLAKNETDKGMLIAEVGKLLEVKGLLPGTEEFVYRARLLRSEDRHIRQQALRDLLGDGADRA